MTLPPPQNVYPKQPNKEIFLSQDGGGTGSKTESGVLSSTCLKESCFHLHMGEEFNMIRSQHTTSSSTVSHPNTNTQSSWTSDGGSQAAAEMGKWERSYAKSLAAGGLKRQVPHLHYCLKMYLKIFQYFFPAWIQWELYNYIVNIRRGETGESEMPLFRTARSFRSFSKALWNCGSKSISQYSST